MFSLLKQVIPLPWRIAISVLLFASLIGFVYYKGYSSATKKYEAATAAYIIEKQNLEAKVKEAQGKVKEVIVTKYVDKIKVIKEKEYVYKNQAISVVPSQYELSNGWVSLHDASARGEPADATRIADETTSGIKDNQALAVITENYSICAANAEQLKLLQEFINESKKAIDEANKKGGK